MSQQLFDFKLGKQDHKLDERTPMLAEFLTTPITGIPAHWDFETGRSAFPVHMWGNDAYGDCVIAARCNHQQRLQRLETRQTIPMTDQMAIDTYKKLTGCQAPDDENDTGLVMLDANVDWRHGWHLPVWDKAGRTYSIDMFGELHTTDHDELRAATFLLDGIEFGLSLPYTAQEQIRKGQQWDVVNAPGNQPGTWGGHAVMSCHYDAGGFYVWTWGRKQYMTNAFVDKYADEAWGIVQSNETHSKYIDVPGLEGKLKSLGVKPVK